MKKIVVDLTSGNVTEEDYTEAELSALVPVKFDPEPILSRVRDAREVVLNRIAGIALAAMVASDQATVEACLVARTSLLGITTVPAVKSATDDASLTAALESAYLSIVAAAPANVKLAFRDFRL